MRFFGLKTCDTCRKALKALADREVEVIDVRADGVSDADRAAMVAAFGEAVINKRSTTWRGLSEVEQSLDLDTLLKKHPTLLKRPVIEDNGVWHQGWTAEVQTALEVK
ncbi:putative reductase [Pseudooctadecabacter jejudonensis]|uniref:Putative reductase n=2 Tax=Pseudooctadecabacter jejudonensis TaxID=1391910 RepID=A0A1Y5RN89_9RHOB|nr:ArsC/Spx/MgsR family protein [Pseudooctadecabacter jejudonensis]SLN21525.1 putative reductase [Pseudooctadecabacter jejudonensis]